MSMEHEDVLRAWTYWEKMGVIRKIRRESADKFDYDVEFVLLKEQFYGDKESKRPVGLDQSMQAAMGDKEIQEMFQAIETGQRQCAQRHGNAGDRILDQRLQCDAGGDRLRLCLLCQTQENKYQIYRSSDQWLDSERFSGTWLLWKNT